MVDLAAYFRTVPFDEAPLQVPLPILIKDASRSDLPALFRERGYRRGAEIGVLYGDYSEELCKSIPGINLLCIDAWAPYRSGRTGKLIFRRAIQAEVVARQRLGPYGCEFIKAYSVEAARLVPDASLDFVYIDANHWFEHVVADLAAWIPKVRPGGCIAGHDYEEDLEEDNCVKLAVTSWTIAHRVNPWFVLGRPKVRRGEHRDEHRSWLWFKE